MELEQRLDSTVDEAIFQFSYTGDTQYFCEIDEFSLMLEKGADYRKLNQIVLDCEFANFAHQAIYKELTFISLTHARIFVPAQYQPELD